MHRQTLIITPLRACFPAAFLSMQGKAHTESTTNVLWLRPAFELHVTTSDCTSSE